MGVRLLGCQYIFFRAIIPIKRCPPLAADEVANQIYANPTICRSQLWHIVGLA